MKEKNKEITIHKKQATIFLGIVILLLFVLIVVMLVTKNNANNRFKKAIEITNYKVEISVLENKEEIAHYSYYNDGTLQEFTSYYDDAMKDHYFFDANHQKLYYENLTTHQYSTEDRTSDLEFQSFLKVIASADLKNWFGNSIYEIHYSDLKDILMNSNNLIYSFLVNKGYQYQEKDTEAIVRFQKNQLQSITMDVVTDQGTLTFVFVFSYPNTVLTLPVANDTYQAEITSAKWMILYLQRVYAEESSQNEKVITDLSYIMESSYGDELNRKLSIQPSTIQVTLMATTEKGSGAVSGSITFVNGVTLTIVNNVIVSS